MLLQTWFQCILNKPSVFLRTKIGKLNIDFRIDMIFLFFSRLGNNIFLQKVSSWAKEIVKLMRNICPRQLCSPVQNTLRQTKPLNFFQKLIKIWSNMQKNTQKDCCILSPIELGTDLIRIGCSWDLHLVVNWVGWLD